MRSHSARALFLICCGCVLLGGCRRASPEAGAILYKKDCSGCHRDGTTQAFAPSLSGYLSEGEHDESATRRVIREGKGNMPPFGKRLSRTELNDLLAYMKTL